MHGGRRRAPSPEFSVDMKESEYFTAIAARCNEMGAPKILGKLSPDEIHNLLYRRGWLVVVSTKTGMYAKVIDEKPAG